MKTIALLIAIITLSACGKNVVDANYAEYARAVSEQNQLESQRIAAIAESSKNCNGDPTCVVSVAGFSAMAAKGGGNSNQLQQHVRQPSAFENGLVALGGPLVGAAASVYSTKIQSSAATDQAGLMWGAIGTLATGSRDVAVSAVENAGARYNVGGNLGDTHTGDIIRGDGNATRGSNIGDTAGRDIAGRDIIYPTIIRDNAGRDTNPVTITCVTGVVSAANATGGSCTQ